MLFLNAYSAFFLVLITFLRAPYFDCLLLMRPFTTGTQVNSKFDKSSIFKFRQSALLGVLLAAGLINTTQASSDLPIYNPLTGKPLFMYRIYDQGEEYFESGYPATSTFTLSNTEKQALVSAGNYWAEMLAPGAKNSLPLYFTIGTYDDKNAYALSPMVNSGPWTGMTELAAGLIGNAQESQQANTPPAFITIGNPGNWAILKPAQLSENGDQWPLTAVMVHEIGHALGVSSNSVRDENYQWHFGATLSKWDEHLYDQNGKQAEANARILYYEIDSELSWYEPSDFLVVRDEPTMGYGGRVYFKGAHVDEVLQGAWLTNPGDINGTAMPGIPIYGWENGRFDGSHIELNNSMMSHQKYRSYTTFMEAELAILQDIGYSIDRKNFFGYSVYGDGLTLTNTQGYFGRNADGTAYLPGVANTASFGVGLHIYGSSNKITQAADLLANGVAGVGARVDGAGNILRIAPGVRVQGNGDYGTGLLVAYGKDHQIIHQGSLSATGVDGIAARFDFGDNLMGSKEEYRGSYIRTKFEAWTDTDKNLGDLNRYNLDGSLVSRFDVTGSLTGRKAAIYIGKNALVKEINIMRGASLSGDIISDWDVTNPRIDFSGNKEDLVSTLSFGYAPQADGSISRSLSRSADPNFALRYDGNISGASSTRFVVAGGALEYNGHAKLLSVENQDGATLSGGGIYALLNSGFGGLSDVGGFSNAGTLSPGRSNTLGSLMIIGDYTQTATGALEMKFAADGNTATLVVNGNATVDGRLQFRPIQDYYRSGTDIVSLDSSNNAPMIEVNGTKIVNFMGSPSLVSDSPTLTMSLATSGGVSRVSVSRAANAYSQYAGSNDNGAQVGFALSQLGGNAKGDMQNLVGTLDFSTPGIIGQALPQLSPAVYDAASSVLLDNNRLISSLVTDQMLSTTLTQPAPSGEGRAFVIPFGSSSRQQNRADFIGYDNQGGGILGGIEKQLDNGLTAGIHAVFSHNTFDAQTVAGASNKVDSLAIGAHALYKPDSFGGGYSFGQLRLGMEENEMKRHVSFVGYSRTSESNWRSFSGAASLGVGYEVISGSMSFGPLADLSYAVTNRPSINEKKGDGSRLHIDSSTLHSLSSRLGVKTVFVKPLENNAVLTTDFSAAWRHELLDTTQTSAANFIDYGSARFDSQNRLPGRDSLTLQARLALLRSNNFSVAIQIGSEFFRPGFSSVQGEASLMWKF